METTEIEALKKENEALKKENEALRARVVELEAKLAKRSFTHDSAKAAGALGGRATAAKLGREHLSEIGRKGAAAMRAKKHGA